METNYTNEAKDANVYEQCYNNLIISWRIAGFFDTKTRERGLEMTETGIVAIAVAAISLVGNLVGSFLAHRKSTAIIVYRIDELEKKVQKHNNLIERTFQLEKRCEVIEEKIKVANHRIEDLEKAEKAVVRR